MAVIKVRNLKKDYKTHKRGHTFMETVLSVFARKTVVIPALKGISFEIKKGELVGFVGPNGAGKSTTLKILTGVIYPTGGEAEIMGYVPWKQRKKYVAHVGAVFGQKSQLIWDIPPIDAFYMNRAIYDIDEKPFQERMAEMTEMLELGDVIHKPVRQLSLGERMKCEFIMAMLHRPEIVFLDEPTIGLDVIAKDRIREFIKSMNRKGVTIILTTHDLEDIEHLAERIMVINHGEIVFDDKLKMLKSHLGEKKQVHLTTQNDLRLSDDPGIRYIDKISGHEVKLELDLNRLSLNDFIDRLNKTNTILDLTIEELPIDRVIKTIYARTSHTADNA